MDKGSKKFYPYLTEHGSDHEGGNKQFCMELLQNRPRKRCRIVLTPAGNRAALWDFGTTSYDSWSVFLVDHEVRFTIAYGDLERFWTVCDRAAAATVACSGRRDRGLEARDCTPEEIEAVRYGPSPEDREYFVNFGKSFSDYPVVNRFLFKILFPKEERPRPVH